MALILHRRGDRRAIHMAAEGSSDWAPVWSKSRPDPLKFLRMLLQSTRVSDKEDTETGDEQYSGAGMAGSVWMQTNGCDARQS